jgi:hypothetical protein
VPWWWVWARQLFLEDRKTAAFMLVPVNLRSQIAIKTVNLETVELDKYSPLLLNY